MSSLAEAGARGALAALLSQGVSLVTRLTSVIILARLLIPEYFGLVAVVAAIAEFAAAVIEFGLPLAAAQADSLSPQARSTLFILNTLLGLLFATAFIFGTGLVAELYGDKRLTEIVRWLSLVPLAVGISAQFRAQLMRDLRFITLEVITTASRIIGMAAAVIVAISTGSIYALVLLAVLPQLIQVPWFAATAHWHPGCPGAWKESGQVIAIGSRIFGINLMRNISRTALVPVLGVFESPKNVGFYDRAYQLSATPANALMDSLQRIAVPILSRVRTDRSSLQTSFEKVQISATMTLVSAIWVVAAVGEPIVILSLGDAWRPAGRVMEFLAIGAGFRLMGMMQQWLFIAGQATGSGLIFSIWAQPLVVLLSLAGLPWGIIGVSITSAAAWGVFWPLSTVAAASGTGLKPFSVLSDAASVAIGFCAPVALSAALPRLFLSDPPLIVFAGCGSALTMASILLMCRPKLRQIACEVTGAIIGRSRLGNQ